MENFEEYDPICLDIDYNDKFFMEVGLRDKEVVVIVRFENNTSPMVMTVETYMRLVMLQLNVSHAAEILKSKIKEKCDSCGK